MHCPIMEQMADGKKIGRCWLHLKDSKLCPRHGDVSKAVDLYKKTGRLTLESNHVQSEEEK